MDFGADNSADNWISQFRIIDKIYEQLKFIVVLLYSLDTEGQKKFRPQILKFEKYLSNNVLMRKIRYRDALISDHPTEYYGKDLGDDDPFLYLEELEAKITNLSMEIMACLGLVVKHVKEQEFTIPPTL